MDWVSLFAIATALAMDAFAVAIVAGLTLPHIGPRHVFRLAFHFGLFQALMPVAGWLGGRLVQGYIAAVDHWIAFGLLAFVGGKMLWEAMNGEGEEALERDPTRGWSLVGLSVATSIDAAAVGLSLAVMGEPVALPALVIGLVAASFTTIGMLLGRRIGAAWGKRVEVLGGLVLIGIGLRILIEHLSS